MTCTDALGQFLAWRFPGWGVCHFCFDVATRTVYLRSATPGRRTAILNDAQTLAYLDIGVDKFVVEHPDFPDVIIPHISNQIL